MDELLGSIQELGEFVFTAIPKGTMKETSVTDFLLSHIESGENQTSHIRFDDTYKETGNREKNPKSGTSADYILIIKNKNGDIKRYAFQAKNGKLKSRMGNVYLEIDHRIGGKGAYQVDEYKLFLDSNLDIEGYYIFYNGDYNDVDNRNNITQLFNQSFWVLDAKKVKELMGSDHKVISLDDIITEENHIKFIDFLRGLIDG